MLKKSACVVGQGNLMLSFITITVPSTLYNGRVFKYFNSCFESDIQNIGIQVQLYIVESWDDIITANYKLILLTNFDL